MWTAIRTTLSQWYIAGIGIFLIAAGLFLASHWSSSPAPVAAAQDHQSPALEIAARASPPALPAMPKATATAAPSAPSIQAPSIQQPSAPASAPALDHTMAQGMTTAQAQPASGAAPTNGGDAVAGRLVFRKCQACHSMEPGKTILGPSLAGILGRKAGSDPGYSYSPAMKQANIVWDTKSLDAYLGNYIHDSLPSF
jgi:nitrite reductase (NO-forming)